jgi:hypothetical protein
MCLGLSDAHELDAGGCLAPALDVSDAPEIVVPEGAAEFPVGRVTQADVFLTTDDLQDLLVFDRFEVVCADLAFSFFSRASRSRAGRKRLPTWSARKASLWLMKVLSFSCGLRSVSEAQRIYRIRNVRTPSTRRKGERTGMAREALRIMMTGDLVLDEPDTDRFCAGAGRWRRPMSSSGTSSSATSRRQSVGDVPASKRSGKSVGLGQAGFTQPHGGNHS